VLVGSFPIKAVDGDESNSESRDAEVTMRKGRSGESSFEASLALKPPGVHLWKCTGSMKSKACLQGYIFTPKDCFWWCVCALQTTDILRRESGEFSSSHCIQGSQSVIHRKRHCYWRPTNRIRSFQPSATSHSRTRCGVLAVTDWFLKPKSTVGKAAHIRVEEWEGDEVLPATHLYP
jgi:hypothetical protein